MQFVAILPNVFSYMLPETNEDPTPVAQWPSGFDAPDSPSRCLSYNPRTQTDAIQYAISAGCTGAKADLWLHGSDLLVGSSLATLDEKHTLQSLYLDPLLAKLKNRPSDNVSPTNPSGLFADPAQSFVLVLEMKTSSPAALPMLVSQLNALRQHGYLTRIGGRDELVSRPVTIVLTGHKKTVDRPYHDVVFFDSSLDELALEDYDQPWKLSHRAQGGVPSAISSREPHVSQSHKQSTNAALFSATANFHDSIGRPQRGRFSPQQLALIRAQVQAAHRRGLKARYYGVPQGRGRLSEYIWRVLVNEGADLLDVNWEESYRQAWWRRWGTYRPS